MIAPVAQRITTRIVAYQTLNLTEPQGGHHALSAWASSQTPPGTGLRWWETAAAAGSSLGVFALIAAAAQPELSPEGIVAIENAYWPWIGALHSLLDSLIDEPEDTATDQRSLLDYYTTPHETAQRLGLLAAQARHHTTSLPHNLRHELVLAAMVSSYLSLHPRSPAAPLATRNVLEAMGALTKPTMLVFRARRAANRLIPTLQSRRYADTNDPDASDK